MGLFGSLFGKQGKETASNQAYGYLQGAYAPQVATGISANNVLAGALGVGGDAGAAQQGYQDYLGSTGFNNILSTAMQGLTGSAALGGQLQSGSTLRAAQDRASDLGQQSFNNYLSQLGSLSSNGLNAGSIIAGAGGVSSKTGSSGGILGKIAQVGQAAGSIATLSDRRAKTDIKKIGEYPDGLGWYQFRYIGDPRPQEGVMADEVAALRPWALGAVRDDGYQTVRYDMLEAA